MNRPDTGRTAPADPPSGRTYVTNAVAAVRGGAQYQDLRGTVRFTQRRAGVTVQAEITGLPQTRAGFFAFHLHDGVCGDAGGDPLNYFPASDGHYNPGNMPHPMHAGDFPPLLETRNGSAYLMFLTDRFTVGQAIGKAVVIQGM